MVMFDLFYYKILSSFYWIIDDIYFVFVVLIKHTSLITRDNLSAHSCYTELFNHRKRAIFDLCEIHLNL